MKYPSQAAHLQQQAGGCAHLQQQAGGWDVALAPAAAAAVFAAAGDDLPLLTL